MASTEDVSEALVSDLQTRFGDRCLLPGNERYNEAIAIWNGVVDRYPAIVARCENTDNVVAAFEAVSEHDIPLSVKGGGHMTTDHAIVRDESECRTDELRTRI